MDNVVVLIEDHGEHADVLGLYDGIPLTERESYGIGELPDRVFIYRLAICAICDSTADVVHEVITTVIHEVAHHFGIDDDRAPRTGLGVGVGRLSALGRRNAVYRVLLYGPCQFCPGR